MPTLQQALSSAVAELSHRIGGYPGPAPLGGLDTTMGRLCRALGASLAIYTELDADGSATISHRWRPQDTPLSPEDWPLGERLDLARLANHLSQEGTRGSFVLRLDGAEPGRELVPARLARDGVDWVLVAPSGRHGRLRGATLWLGTGQPHDLTPATLELLAALGTLLAEDLLSQLPDQGRGAGEQRWRTLAEATFEAVLVHRNARIVDANDEACGLFKRSRDELIDRPVPGDLVMPHSVPEVEQRIRSHSLDKYEIDIQRPDGSAVPVEIRAREFVVGGVTQRVVALRNISEQKQHEQLLVESYERLYTLLETTFEGILVHRRGEVLEANEGFARMCGYTLDEVIGMVPGDVTTEESAQLIAENIRNRTHVPYVVTGLRKDGSTFPMEIQGVECVYKGERLRITGFRDLTDEFRARDRQRQLEERMQAAQRLESLGMLASGVAHDFNNLLVAILGNAEIAEMSLSGPPVALTALQRIQVASVKASELTRQLQAYAGRRTPEPTPLVLGELVTETADLIRSTLESGVNLDLDIPAPLPPVLADAAQVGQVVLNLLTNASEALEGTGGRIQVSIRRVMVTTTCDGELPGPPPQPGAYLALTVRDNGSGMDADTRQRMFEPFFSTRFSGRGLGLAAVLGIVRGHGGGLVVRSARGVGSEIEVLLPVVDEAGNAPQPLDEEVEGSQDLILVIDDEPDVVLVAKAMLEAADHPVLTALTGEEGIATWLEHRERIALVVLDLAMPDMRGEAVRRVLVEHDPGVRIVFCSGFEASSEIETLLAQGHTRFLQKPYRMRAFLETINAALTDD